MAFVNTDTIITKDLAQANPGHAQSYDPVALSPVSFDEDITLTIAKSGIVNATAATGFDNLISQVDTDVQTWIDTTLGIDTTAKSVDYVATVKRVSAENLTDLYQPDANNNFAVLVNVKVKVY